MREDLKAYRRHKDDPFWIKILSGTVLDVGFNEHQIHGEWYPNIQLSRSMEHYYDDLRKFKGGSFDCIMVGGRLEYENNPLSAILSWLYLLRVGGHLVLTVPDFKWIKGVTCPVRYNHNRKWSFSLEKSNLGTHHRHINLIDFISRLPGIQISRIRVVDSEYDISNKDQTFPETESVIEVVLRKMPLLYTHKKTFKHSGARGDMIYALPVIKMIGGGTLYVNRQAGNYFGMAITDDELDGIRTFLKMENIVDDVVDWNGQPVDYDLDQFRDLDPTFIILSLSYLIRFGVDYDLTQSWITNRFGDPKYDIVVSRTERYHSPFDWGELSPWLDRSVFVGTPTEHKEFIRRTGFSIKYAATKDWRELADIIAASKLFIGNQSFAFAMAEAMKHPRILEVCSFCPNCDPQGSHGHVSLNQQVIRKYVLGEDYQDEIRRSRCPSIQIAFARKRLKRTYNDMTCVLCGDNEKSIPYVLELQKNGMEIIWQHDSTFELAANHGVMLATKSVICFIDVNMCPSEASVMAIIQNMLTSKMGMLTTSTSMVGMPHFSGAVFAVTREAYEKAGLFNTGMCSGEETMLELNLRYSQMGIICQSIGIPGWKGRTSNPEYEARNRQYIMRNFGICL